MLCARCWLVSVPPDHHLAPAAERAVYDRHDNRPDHAGYRQFLRRPAAAVCARVQRPALGLDFGAGPGPTLGLMLVEAGYDMALYDPFYLPDVRVFDERYDFITATEVFEHLAAPAAEIERLLACLQPGGWLIVMTKRHSGDHNAFTRWHYTHDPTHISFFALATFEWIAEHYGLHLEVAAADVVALQKPTG